MNMGNGVVLALAGSKGGVGKTTTSINLSAVLAEQGYEVVLVEMDLAMANVGDFLDIDVGLEGEDPTLHEVLAGGPSVVDATYESPCGFDIVPSGATLEGFVKADVGAVSGALATLRFAYDIVVLDTGAGAMTETIVSLALADETILVSSPRVAAVRDTMKTRDLTRQVGGSVAGVVFVRSGTGRSPGVDHIAEFLSVDLLGHVPEDSAVPDAQDVGLPVAVAERDSAAATAYRRLGERVAEFVDEFNTPSADVLSTDSIGGDDSGFSFIDESPEVVADTDAPEPGAARTPGHHRRANGRADGGRAGAGPSPRMNAAGPAPGTDQRDGGDASNVDVAKAVGEIDDVGDAADDATSRADGASGRPRRAGTVNERTSVADAGPEDADAEPEDADAEPEDADEPTAETDTAVRPEGDDTSDEAAGVVGEREPDEADVTPETDDEGVEPCGPGDNTHEVAGDADEPGERRSVDGAKETTGMADADAPAADVHGDTGDVQTDTATSGETADEVGDGAPEREGDDVSESTRAAAKRFIDRAVGMVDRRDG